MILLIFYVIALNNLQNPDRQSAGAGHAIPALRHIFIFKDRQDDGIPFNKYFDRFIMAENFRNRIKEVKAEMRGGIKPSASHAVADIDGTADVRLDHHMIDDRVFFFDTLRGEQKFIERPVLS